MLSPFLSFLSLYIVAYFVLKGRKFHFKNATNLCSQSQEIPHFAGLTRTEMSCIVNNPG